MSYPRAALPLYNTFIITSGIESWRPTSGSWVKDVMESTSEKQEVRTRLEVLMGSVNKLFRGI